MFLSKSKHAKCIEWWKSNENTSMSKSQDIFWVDKLIVMLYCVVLALSNFGTSCPPQSKQTMQELVFLWLTEGNMMHLISSFLCEHTIHLSNRSRHTQKEICALFPQYVVMLLLADRHPLSDLNSSFSLSTETHSVQFDYTKKCMYDFLFACRQVFLHMAFVSVCSSCDGPRAGPINEFTPAMWHCCDSQILCQACSFPLRVLKVGGRGAVCEGRLCPCFMTRTLPSLHCVSVWQRRREGRNHDSTTTGAHRWNSSSCLNPANGIVHTRSHEYTLHVEV